MGGFLVHAKLTKSFVLRLGLPISEGVCVLTIELSQEPRGTNAGCWRPQTYIWASVLHLEIDPGPSTPLCLGLQGGSLGKTPSERQILEDCLEGLGASVKGAGQAEQHKMF